MRRVRHPPRADFAARAAELGFSFHTIDGAPYWVEDAHYEFTADEVDALDDASAGLEEICIEAVDRLVKDGGGYHLFGLSDLACQLVEASWRNRHRHVYGRMDLAFDGSGPPKLLEYNADTPTALFEAAVVQWEWLQAFDSRVQQEGGPDQFNSIHEKLVEAWRQYGIQGAVHFTSVGPGLSAYVEDRGTTDYMRDAAHQAGLASVVLDIEAIGWNGSRFTDAEGRVIETLWKLYPWEWLVAEEYGKLIPESRCLFIEPAWKMLLSNKAILPVLWQMFEGHPNLLPAFFEPGRIDGPEVSKPILGREGANVALDGRPETPGEYGTQPRIFQAQTELFRADGQHAVVGSWLIAGHPAGIGVREDTSPVTTNASRFVPHLFR
ncbi:MAG: glutathionylspermidine synthase family protein [Acetobacteraceae bacterium]|nr:glutathionylspermidine synthase family protein [Acetobacteraceae bacterium]